jgi:serine/threonine protein kinase
MGCTSSSERNVNPLEVDLSHFELLKVVGKGGFGKVNAVMKLDSNELMALKRMEKYAVLQSNHHLRMVWIERKIMSAMRDCHFLVHLEYAFHNDKELFLVMPFMQGGDLRYHLKERGTMSEDVAKFYAAEIALGLEALHRRHIVFRDLKPDNSK